MAHTPSRPGDQVDGVHELLYGQRSPGRSLQRQRVRNRRPFHDRHVRLERERAAVQRQGRERGRELGLERANRGVGLHGGVQRVRKAPPLAEGQPQDRVPGGDRRDDREHVVPELPLLGERVEQRDVRRHPGCGVLDRLETQRLERRWQRDHEDEGSLGRWSQRAGHSAGSTSRTLRLPVRTIQNRPCSGCGSGAAGSVIRSLFT